MIPTWNSSLYLDQTLRTIVTRLSDIETLQVIVIDDGSSDGTFHVAERTLEGLPHVSYTVVQLAKNLGQSAATAIGLGYAVGDVAVTLDDDLSFAPIEIYCLLDSLSESVDFVMGAPRRYHNSKTRRFFSGVARMLAVRAFKLPHDFVLSSFLAYQKDFLLRLDFSGIPADEVGWMFGYTSRYLNTPVTSSPSIRKNTKYGIRKLVRTAKPLMLPLLKLMISISRVTSGFTALIAAFMAATYLFRALVIGGLLSGFPTVAILLLLNLSIVATLLSLQLSSIVTIHKLRKPDFLMMRRRVVTRM